MKNLFAFSTLLTILLTSCATVYRPNMTTTPLFTEKGQVALEGAYSRDGVNLNAAMAVAPAVAIMVNGQINQNTKRSGGLFDSSPSNGRYGEFGVGYFKKMKDQLIFETYVGAGQGFMNDKSKLVDTEYPESLKYNKFFVQPNLGWRPSPSFDLIFAPRLGYVKGDYQGSSIIVNGINEKAKVDFLTLEPTLTLAFGNKQFKFYMQGGVNYTYNTHDANDRLKYSTISSLYNLGVGLKYNFQFTPKS